jgi:hypothetical protein
MDKINAAIVTFFMNNLDKKTVDLQRQVVDKFNPEKYPHYSILTEFRHGASMDMFWQMNGVDHATFKGQNVAKRFDHDVVFFLDVDAVPLNEWAIQHTVHQASVGKLIGNIQRTNHIQNDQHVFVAPSCLAISVDSFVTIGRPSGLETKRADVAEEYTFAAEKSGIVPVEFYMPLKFDEKPAECESWALKDGMPVYGRFTTFGVESPMFLHAFQSFHEGQQEKFWKKCESLLTVNEPSAIIV